MGNFCGARYVPEIKISVLCDICIDNYKKYRKCGKREGENLLLTAVKKGHIYCVKALLESGADVNNNEHTAAIMEAVWDDDDECLKLLLRSGTEVNDVKFKDLINNALICVAKGHSGECSQLLVKEGADVNSVNSTGETALTFASSCQLFECGRSYFDGPIEPL